MARAAADDRAERESLAGDLPGKVRPALDAIVAAHGAEPIAWSRHLRYLHDFESAVVQARRLLRAEASSATPAGGDSGQQLAAMAWLVDAARAPDEARLDDLLLTEARKLPEPIQWPGLAVYELFAPLLRLVQIRGAHG